jgi:hypothetical protein
VNRPDPEEQTRNLASASVAANDPTGWFERLYAAADRGDAVVPWDRGSPHFLLVQWAEDNGVRGDGRRAVIVGCGLGFDAEYVAGLGFDTVAFDVAPSGVAAAISRHPHSPVDYRVADLLALPDEWLHAFDLVVESLTVQSLPVALRGRATAAVAGLVAPGGSLLVVAAARDDDGSPVDGPPWPLTRAEVDAFAGGGIETVRVEDLRDATQPTVRRWRAEFRR